MTRKSLLHPSAPPAVLAASVIFSKRLLIAEKSTAGALDLSGSSLELLIVRSTKLTSTLREIEGYSHHGLNE
jgi:hypothetical protein